MWWQTDEWFSQSRTRDFHVFYCPFVIAAQNKLFSSLLTAWRRWACPQTHIFFRKLFNRLKIAHASREDNCASMLSNVWPHTITTGSEGLKHAL